MFVCACFKRNNAVTKLCSAWQNLVIHYLRSVRRGTWGLMILHSAPSLNCVLNEFRIHTK